MLRVDVVTRLNTKIFKHCGLNIKVKICCFSATITRQEPGNNRNKDFCETNFGITFPMTEKINVIGNNSHPFYKWARKDYGIGAIPSGIFIKL